MIDSHPGPVVARTMREVASLPRGATVAAAPDVVLDLPRSRHMSYGMRAYAETLARLVPQLAPDLTVETLERPTTASFSEQALLPGALARLRGRLVHHLSPYAPILGPTPFVVTVHDLIHLRYPAYFKRTVGVYYEVFVRRVLAAAARVIVDDERTVGDLALYLDVDPAKVRVVPLGIDERFRARKTGTAERAAGTDARPYVLYVGNHRTHKDLPTLFAAWAALPDGAGLDLLLTGDARDLAGTPLPWRRDGRLRFLGAVADDDLPELYEGASALVQPSLCEGYGLPLVEAAAVGTRVVACEEAVPAALAPYVERFAPRDHAALAALLAAAPDPARLVRAREAARQATWERCALATIEIYRDVLARETA